RAGRRGRGVIRTGQGGATGAARAPGQEAERLQQALVGGRAGLRTGRGPARVAEPGGRVVQRLVLAGPGPRGEQRGVVGLDPVAGLDGPPRLTALAQLAAAAAALEPGGLVALAVLMAVVLVLAEDPGPAAEELAGLLDPVRDPV